MKDTADQACSEVDTREILTAVMETESNRMKESQTTDIHRYRTVNATLSTSGQPTEAQLRALARDGFETVINLALHDDPRYSLADEPGEVEALGMRYVHIPVAFDSPTESDLLAFFDAMERHRREKTLVHCAANLRVSAFVGLYMAIKRGDPVDQAFALMKSIWEPDPVWAAFITAMLEKYRR